MGNKTWPAIGKASRHMGFVFINWPNWFFWWTSQYGQRWCLLGAISFINMSVINKDTYKGAHVRVDLLPAQSVLFQSDS